MIRKIPAVWRVIRFFALEEDRLRRLWIGTAGGGLCLYEGDETFSTLNESNSPLIHRPYTNLIL